MDHKENAFREIGIALAKHFVSLFFVDIETGTYEEFIHMNLFDEVNIPTKGENFFTVVQDNAYKCIHPRDLDLVISLHDKKTMLRNLSTNSFYSTVYRLIINGKVNHVRHIAIMCEDKRHIICCLEDIENEIQQKEAQQKDLQSAKRQAKLDDLTGIRNKNAYIEYASVIDEKLEKNMTIEPFAVVMCDVNDLKLINDTRGHSFGDESIQRASRMVCGVFEHSPVFRVGGDEFVAILKGRDYEQRENLIVKLKEESLANKRSRSGPVVACGMAEYDPEKDKKVDDVYERADEQMYVVKNELKSAHLIDELAKMEKIEAIISDERKRLLDSMFGALYTVAGEGYVYLNDMKYDFSRWSLSLVDDFNLKSEYMYHADRIWQDYIHPEDIHVYKKAVDAAICGNAQVTPFYYRARRGDGSYVMLTTRAFILSDSDGKPDYFGGIIIPQ